jgi:hypothetical protein
VYAAATAAGSSPLHRSLPCSVPHLVASSFGGRERVNPATFPWVASQQIFTFLPFRIWTVKCKSMARGRADEHRGFGPRRPKRAWLPQPAIVLDGDGVQTSMAWRASSWWSLGTGIVAIQVTFPVRKGSSCRLTGPRNCLGALDAWSTAAGGLLLSGHRAAGLQTGRDFSSGRFAVCRRGCSSPLVSRRFLRHE